MMVEMCKSKIHRATVTDKNINYEGSITIDESLLKAAKIRVYEKVSVFNLNTGDRFETYAIKGKAGSGIVCLNGASARLGEAGDPVIILSYGMIEDYEAEDFEPNIVLVDQKNRIKDAKSKNLKKGELDKWLNKTVK